VRVCLDNNFVTLVHVDSLLVKFEGQCHRSKFTVTEENVANVVSETSGEDFVVSSQSINGGRIMSREPSVSLIFQNAAAGVLGVGTVSSYVLCAEFALCVGYECIFCN